MKIKTFFLILTVCAVTSSPAIACKKLEQNQHMGTIMSIDFAEESFVLKEAKTGYPLTFKAPLKMLKSMTVKEIVVVSYEIFGHQMIAKKIECQIRGDRI